MVETDRPEAQIYQLRAVLRGISPLIWRRLLVRSDSTVARLHEVLQIAFGWDDEHLNRFEIRGREYAVYRDGGGMIGIDARVVRLCDLKLRRLERFVYEYDFGDRWNHELRLETTLPVNPRTIYPMCMAGKRAAPPEDCGGPDAFMSSRGHITVRSRGQSIEELDDFEDELDDEYSDRFDDYDPDRFDRRQINRALHKLAAGSYRKALDEIHYPTVDETLTDLMFEMDGAIEEDREARRPVHLVLKKLARALEEFGTYIDNNASGIVNYGERHRCGERISTGFVESTINQLIAKRFVKKQPSGTNRGKN